VALAQFIKARRRELGDIVLIRIDPLSVADV
jgi:hypothetical protein